MSKQSYISEKCQHWSWHQSQDDHSSATQADEGLQEAPGDYYLFNEVHFDAVSKIIIISSSTTIIKFLALIGGPSGWGVRSSRGEQHYVVERCDLRSPRDSL